jgi:ESS family glutamate:Na+ symporter
MTAIQVPGLLTFTIAIVVFFTGAGLNRVIEPLHRWNIPEAVTGGLVAAIATLLAYKVLGIEVSFSLDARDLLLLYFFTGIGVNAKLEDLVSGGRPFVLLLALTLVYLVIQNLIAAGSVAVLGLPKGIATLVGSASLIGGHGTTIAWAPIITERFGLPNALEVGIATATLGLVVASLVGGPIAGILIARHHLAGPSTPDPVVGLPDDPADKPVDDISHIGLLRTLLVLNVVILIGYFLDDVVAETGVKLPLFVVCLLVGIIVTNTIPRILPTIEWPTRTRALALVSDLSLNIFLAMSLMSMQLWTLGGLGPALVVVLAAQTLGRNYEAAVISAGFTGISLGATPTAIANMTAVTKLHGPCARAFIILPLVSAFFIDIANALAIGFMVR